MRSAGTVSRLPYGMTGDEPAFERAAALASALFGKVYVSIVIVSDGAVWRNIDPDGQLILGTPFADPVTESGVAQWWADTTQAPELAASVLVTGPPFIRFAAAAPVRLPGGDLQGAIAVAGLEPRPYDADLLANLERLAAMIADECDRARTRERLSAREAEAERSAWRERVFAAVAPASIVMTDLELRVIKASQRFLNAAGYTENQVLGRTLAEVIPEYDRRFGTFIQRCLEGETVAAERVAVRLPGRGILWLRVEMSPWRDSEGRIAGVISATTDISDLVEALERTERSEQRLSLAAQIADLHVWELDYARGELIQSGAPTAVFDQEWTYEQLALDSNRTIHPDDRALIGDEWVQAVNEDRPFFPEYRVVRLDNREVWAKSAVKLVRGETGEPLRLVGALLNITDRKQTEVALRQAKEAAEAAEAANKAKSAFLATMSHEIRTPLNGVLGMAQVMAADELSDTQRERLEVVRRSGESLLAILNDVLDLSKIEAGKLELEAAEFDIAEVVEGVFATFEPLARGKGLDLSVEIAEPARGVYLADSVRVRQVLLNLVSNALKFTDDGAVRIRVAREAGLLSLEVADTGIGLTPEQAARLFDKFEQADVSTTRRYGGTGLGLSICRELVELMGGTIAVRSAPGEGACFTVRLPLPWIGPAADAPATPTETAQTSAPPPVRVLAAEDNPVNRMVLTAMLEQAGLEPEVVGDGAEAVARWRAEPWDLILMDVQMPGMDGPEATRIIRAEEAATGRPRTPIIALTANAMSHQVADYLAGGMDDFVAKPLEIALLFAAMERVLEPA